MSFRTLTPCMWTANRIAQGGSVVLTASAPSATAAEQRVTSKATSALLRARRTEAAISQKRKHFRPPDLRLSDALPLTPPNLGLFHQTTTRRSEVVIYDAGEILIECLAVLGLSAGIIGFTRHLTGYSTLAPHTWARHAKEQTRNEVEMTMSVAFNMARNAPINQQNQYLREATFQVPHELARLNSEAPDFRLEDLGPMAPGKLPLAWDVGFFPKSTTERPLLDAKTETRAFLYFPNGSPKATAVFLAVNSELRYPTQAGIQYQSSDSGKALALLQSFRIVYQDWQSNRPSLVGRIEEVDRLPVICNFREHVLGSLYYPIIGFAGIPIMALTPLVISDFGLKTSYLGL